MKETGNLYELLSRSATARPGDVAVVNPGCASLTYGELGTRAESIRSVLRGHGVSSRDRVGIYAPKSTGTVASIFGILGAGAAYVPVDPTAPPRRNAEIMADCGCRALVIDSTRVSAFCEQVGRELQVLAELESTPGEPSLVLLQGPATDPASSEDDLAYILYTSGSTGRPKGVMHTHASAASFVDWCSEELAPTSSDRFSSHAPFHFDLSILDLYVPLKHGAAVVLIGDEVGKQPLKLAALLEEQDLTVWYSTPSILRLLLEYGKLGPEHGRSLRLVLFAGEVFPIKHLRALMNLWPHPRYYNLYGPTETNVCTYYEVPGTIPDERTEPLPIGRASSDDRLLVVDEDDSPVARGEKGELLVAGGSVMTGYWNRPERTESAFHVDSEGTRWYRTGDVVIEEVNGNLGFAGRKDRMVKRRGYRVELGEIEAALYRHDRVEEAAVVAVADEESGVRIQAFMSCNGEKPPSIIEMKQFCASNLPSYMIPDRLRFLGELPKTSTDKIDYQALAGLS